MGWCCTKCCRILQKGDLIGIKGRIQSSLDRIEVIAEKVTFLSSNKQAYQN